MMGGFGMAQVVEQLADLKLGELLDTPPPGFDEAVAISKARRAWPCGSAAPCAAVVDLGGCFGQGYCESMHAVADVVLRWGCS